MTIELRGRPGSKTLLTSDDTKFGLVTQAPEQAMHHTLAGLEDSNGNTLFGTHFMLTTHFTSSNPTGGDTTLTKTLCNSDAPYKMRVLSVKVTMLDEANGRLREAGNSCSVSVKAGSGSIASGDISDMRQLEERMLNMGRTGGEVVATDGSLSVNVDLRLGETGVTDTLSLLVELTCIRVI